MPKVQKLQNLKSGFSKSGPIDCAFYDFHQMFNFWEKVTRGHPQCNSNLHVDVRKVNIKVKNQNKKGNFSWEFSPQFAPIPSHRCKTTFPTLFKVFITPFHFYIRSNRFHLSLTSSAFSKIIGKLMPPTKSPYARASPTGESISMCSVSRSNRPFAPLN